MIKITEDVHVAADHVAAVEYVADRTRSRVRVTLKDGEVHWLETGFEFNEDQLRAEMRRIINEIDTQLTIQAGGDS